MSSDARWEPPPDSAPQPPVRVLVVEDDPLDYELTAARLAEVPGLMVVVERAAGYEQGLEAIRRCQHDVYLIDYRLGHRDGIELLREGMSAGCTAPMIILTGQGSARVDVDAMRAGAADYVVKDSPDPASLGRSVRYAVERRRLLAELEQAKQRRQQEQELIELARRLGPPTALAVTAEALGLRPLREVAPAAFDALVRRFGELLDAALEQAAYKTASDPVSPALRALAEQVGAARGGPGDVIDVYTTALRNSLAAAPVGRGQALVQEGRALALGLMGHVASYYRAYCVRVAGPGVQGPGGAATVAGAGAPRTASSKASAARREGQR